MKRLWKPLLAGLIVLAIIGAVIVAIIWLQKPPYNIPEQLISRNAFSIYVGAPNTAWKIDSKATEYIESSRVLSLHFKRSDGTLIIMTQQATPTPFNDIPQYYSILLNKLREYSEIDTGIGTVALTHPVELKGGQSAVINTRGTLLFAHPTKTLSDDDWKAFFDGLITLH